jgi:AcrR family transcriptional regulator
MSIVLSQNQVVRRDRVIEAAMRLAGEGGYDAVQMRDVAAEAQVALGTIYRYFSSKDHLLAATMVEWARTLHRQLRTRPPRGDTPAERVVDVVRRVTKAIEEEANLAAALVTAISAPDPAVSECQAEVGAVMAQMLSEPMDGVDRELAAGVIRVMSHVWFSALVGWVNGWSNVGQAGDELECAARLLLAHA